MSVTSFDMTGTTRPNAIPDVPFVTGMTDEEQQLLAELQSHWNLCRWDMELDERYYLGTQVIENLRIAVPKELEFLRTIVGWPSLAVDPYVERLFVDGFRLPGATDADQDLRDLWDANGLDAELPLAVTDALSMRCGYWMAGSNPETGGVPVITVESPLNMAVKWDLRGTTPLGALHAYWSDNRKHADLLTPNSTVTVAEDENGKWRFVDRDDHDLGFVPVVRMPHMPRTTARDGRSAITPAIKSITDSACRTLLDLEVARELYSVPAITLLGATEADFQKSDGTPKTAWETYITRVRAMERDEEGNLPAVHQATPYDPSTFTRLIEMYASQMASLVCAPPQDMGLYTQGNPVSPEQTVASEVRRNRRAKLMQKQFGPRLVEIMKMGLRLANKGELPRGMERFDVDWHDVDEVPMSLASDAISKQVAAGSVPPTSDVVLKRLGYSAVERARLAQDAEAASDAAAEERIMAALNGSDRGEQQAG